MDAAITELDRLVAAEQFDTHCVAAVKWRQ